MTNMQFHDYTPAAGATLEMSNFDDALERWESLAQNNPAARIYHSTRWLDLLRRAYGFDLFLASLRSRSQVLAGCVMARSRNPFARRLVAMPFSDRCEPLVLDAHAGQILLTMLAADPRIGACEIRGTVAPAPWRTVDCFQNWALCLSLPASRLYQRLATNFRRNIARAQRIAMCVERGSDLSLLSRFYLMHCESRRRQGVPAQPASFFRLVRDLFAPSGDFDVWIASHNDVDLASVVTLRDRDCVYYKWSARSTTDASGAGHLLTWSIIETIATSAYFLDLGRTDLRNHGLNRFKCELGAVACPLPYSFIPRVPRTMSSEILSGWHALAANIWRRMPAPMCRAIGSSLYRYLS